MFKNLLILLLSIFLLFSCSKKNNEKVLSEPTDKEKDNEDSGYLRPLAVNA